MLSGRSIEGGDRGVARALVLALALVLLAALTPSPAGASPTLANHLSANGANGESPTGSPPPASSAAGVEGCVTAVEQAERSATFVGQMVATSSTQRMSIQIEVQERLAGETLFHTIDAPGFGVWRNSSVGVKIYKYLKQVTGLPGPASYRAVVRFRWLGAKGHVLKHLARRTSDCEQPDQRARLVVSQLLVTPLAGGVNATYQILLTNTGHQATVPSRLALTVNGIAGAPLQAPEIAGSARAWITTVAPRCGAGSTIEVQVDLDHAINEAPGGGLPYALTCPLAT